MIYFLYGENNFALRRAAAKLTAEFVENHGTEAITRLDGDQIESQNLLAEIVNINMFAPRRLIIVKNAENNKATWTMLGDNLNRLPAETDLLIMAKKPDKRTKTYKELLKIAECRQFAVLSSSTLQKWAIDEASYMGLKIDAPAIKELLVITAGDDDQQSRLADELAKLQVLGRPVTIELIHQFVEPNLAGNAFEILNLAIAGERGKLNQELKNLRESGEDANKFLGLLASQIFALAAAVFSNKNIETSRELKIHPFQLTKASELANQIGTVAMQRRAVKKLAKIFAETDAKMKLADSKTAWRLVEISLNRV